MGNKYWYCALADHISFVNERWFRITASNLPVASITIEHFSHTEKSGASQYLTDALKNIIYRFMPQLFRLLRKTGLGGIDVQAEPHMLDYPPGWRSAKDHIIVLLKKSP